MGEVRITLDGTDFENVLKMRSNIGSDDALKAQVNLLVTWFIRIHSDRRRRLMLNAMQEALLIDIGLRNGSQDVIDFENHNLDMQTDAILEHMREWIGARTPPKINPVVNVHPKIAGLQGAGAYYKCGAEAYPAQSPLTRPCGPS